MENRENGAAGKEHRMESPPFLSNERDKNHRPYSRKNIFLKKYGRQLAVRGIGAARTF